MRAARCEICDLLYCPDIKGDRRLHSKLHRAALDARQALAASGPEPLPLSYAARERMKVKHTASQGQHLELVMWSHYARSLEAMNYDLAKHPSWTSYARAYLAQPHTRESFGDAAVDQVISSFEPDQSCGERRTMPAFHLDPGGSYARLARRRSRSPSRPEAP